MTVAFLLVASGIFFLFARARLYVCVCVSLIFYNSMDDILKILNRNGIYMLETQEESTRVYDVCVQLRDRMVNDFIENGLYVLLFSFQTI